MTTTDDTQASRYLALKIARAGRRVLAGLIGLEGVMFALGLAHWHHLGPAVPAAGAAVCLLALGLTTCITRDLEHATRPGPGHARQPACFHASAVPVDTLDGERVAWLCPACDRQLPAGHRQEALTDA